MSWLKAVGLLSVLAACDGPLSCTLADCLDNFSIAAGTAGEMPLPPGQYDIELVVDGVQVACRAIIPAHAPFPCSAPEFSLSGLTPREAPPEITSTLLIQTNETPREVEVLIRHDGTELARASYEPMYDTFAPNGVECGPVCRGAREALRLSF